jgi:hypothetical protein
MFNTSTYYNFGVRDYWELTVRISSPGQTYALNIQGTSPKISITWGDGTATYVTTTGNVSRTYSATGDYKVKVSGSFVSNGNIQQAIGADKVIGTSRMRGLMGITSMTNTFGGCTGLKGIPADLFRDHPNVTDFDSTFALSGLQSIPPGLFDYNPNVSGFIATFTECAALTSIPASLFDYNPIAEQFALTFAICPNLASIPPGLFDNNYIATNFSSVFNECPLITSIPTGLFNNNTLAVSFFGAFGKCTNLASIPAGLFDNNYSVIYFDQVFESCSSLTSIPAGLFNNNTAVTEFDLAFLSCTNLTSIPAGLFNNNTQVTTFESTFQNCPKLTNIPNVFSDPVNLNRFLNRSVNFTNCFILNNPFTGVPGTAPALWTYNFGTGTPITTDCWLGHSAASLTNYASIPLAWR